MEGGLLVVTGLTRPTHPATPPAPGLPCPARLRIPPALLSPRPPLRYPPDPSEADAARIALPVPVLPGPTPPAARPEQPSRWGGRDAIRHPYQNGGAGRARPLPFLSVKWNLTVRLIRSSMAAPSADVLRGRTHAKMTRPSAACTNGRVVGGRGRSEAPRTLGTNDADFPGFAGDWGREELDPVAPNPANLAVLVGDVPEPTRRGTHLVAIESGTDSSTASVMPPLVQLRLLFRPVLRARVRGCPPIGQPVRAGTTLRRSRTGAHPRAHYPRLITRSATLDERDGRYRRAVAAEPPNRNPGLWPRA